MKSTACALFICFCLTSQTARAQLSSLGANVTVSATYQIPASGIFENDLDVVNGTNVTGQAVAQSNIATGRASPSGVWVSGSAAGLGSAQPGDISTAGGTASSFVRNLTGGPLVIEGLYAVAGDAWVTAPNIQSSGSGSFSFTMPNNDQWQMQAFANANGSFAANSSAIVRFTARVPGDPTPPLPGSTPDNPFGDQILIAEADLSQQHSDLDREDFIAYPPLPGTGTYLTPIVDSYGRTSPVYLGGGSGTPPTAQMMSASFENDAPAALDAEYLLSDIQYIALGNRITHFTLPYAIGGDSDFLIRYAGQEYDYTVGQMFDFTLLNPDGVASFFLRGVDSGAVNSDEEFLSIVSGLQFAANGATQIYTIGGQIAIVPEPGGMALISFGLIVVLGFQIRSRTFPY